MRERARFTPARDEYGNAVPDFYRGHITWRAAATPPPVLLTPAPRRAS